MFNNLIESSSHTKEFKRRGSFLLFTTVTYVVLFAITGVASIYAYDAHLEQQSTRLEILTFVRELEEEPIASPPGKPRTTTNNANTQLPERAIAMLSVNHPEVVPDEVSAKPNQNPPIPDHGTVKFTGRDNNPESIGGAGTGGGAGRPIVQPQPVANFVEPPPAAETPQQIPKVISKGVITSQATFLPKPSYPPIAKQMRIQGTVSIQVLVDETGNVLSAKVIAGSPFLTAEARKAALLARFSPAKLGDQPVKVSGVITYNFVLNQ
jgi:protein TonB